MADKILGFVIDFLIGTLCLIALSFVILGVGYAILFIDARLAISILMLPIFIIAAYLIGSAITGSWEK